jgi:hypothetical protein
MRYFVTVEFEFESDSPDVRHFAEEAYDVITDVEFVDRFASDTHCVHFVIKEVST